MNLATWIRSYAHTADTLDPAAPLDDMEPLRELIGDARVVAIGEAAHHVREFYLLRHRLLRFLVERCGFTGYAFEAPYVESRAIDAWVHGGPGEVTDVAATSGMALTNCTEMYGTLAWLRAYNQGADRPVWFAGAVAGAGGGGSPLPELLEVGTYLRSADPDALPLLERAIEVVERYHDDATPIRALANYAAVEPSVRDAVTASLSRLLARMESMRGVMREAGLAREHEEALTYLHGAWRLDHFHRDVNELGLAIGTTSLDAFMAESVLRRLEAAPDERIVVGLHNVHIRTTSVEHDGPAGLFPAGHRLAEALGKDYVAIAVTSNHGHITRSELNLEAPSGFRLSSRPLPDVVPTAVESAFTGDAALTVADLRAARTGIDDADSFTQMRMEDYFMGGPVFTGFDAIAYVPHTAGTDAAGTDTAS